MTKKKGKKEKKEMNPIFDNPNRLLHVQSLTIENPEQGVKYVQS